MDKPSAAGPHRVAHGGMSPTGALGAPPVSRDANPYLLIMAVCMCGLSMSVQMMVVVPVLPMLETAFDTDLATVSWVYTGSLLAGAVAGPLLSRFGDMHGRRRMLIWIMGLGALGSAICAVSTAIGPMIAGRVLGGLSAAAIPLSIGILRDRLPPHRVSGAVGIVSATLGIGGGVGIVAAGVVLEFFDGYQPVFWMGAIVCLVGLGLAVAFVRDFTPGTGGTPDFVGGLVFTASMVALLVAVSQGKTWGWTSSPVVFLLGAFVVLLLVVLPIEKRVKDPLIDLKLMAHPRTIASSVTAVFVGLSIFAGFSLASTFAQAPESTGYGLGAGTLGVGVLLLPQSVAMLVFSTISGRIIPKLSASFTVAIGAVLIALCYGWLFVHHAGAADLIGAMVLCGAGTGLAFAGLGTMAIEHVDPAHTGAAAGMNALLRLIGATMSSALIGTVLSSNYTGDTGYSSIHGFEICFAISFGCAVVAAGTAAYFGYRGRRSEVSVPTQRRSMDSAESPERAVSSETRLVARAVDRCGAAVAGAVATIVDEHGREVARGFGDPDGWIELEQPGTGSHLVVVSAPGWRPVADRVLLPVRSGSYRLVLQRAEAPVSYAY